MKIKKLSVPAAVLLLLATTPTYALDLSYGNGEFGMSSAINPLFKADVTLDINTWSLAEQHKNLGTTNLYYHFNLDYFDSDTVNTFTDFASAPLGIPLPVTGSGIDALASQFTTLPVPADYRMHGVDINVGLGYDLIKQEDKTLGLSVTTGLSTPFMKIRNMRNTANLIIDVLDTFDTHIKTYKFGGGLYADVGLSDTLKLSANGSINYQTGKMDNDIVGSGIDISGTYTHLGLSLKYMPKQLKHFYIVAGYDYNKWNYDSATVSTPVSTVQIPRVMDIDFDSTNTYLGAGYEF